MPLLIVVLFYAYTVLLGHHPLALDMVIFIAAVAAGRAGPVFPTYVARRLKPDPPAL